MAVGVSHPAKIGQLTIPSGQQDSAETLSIQRGRVGLGAGRGIAIFAPPTLDGTVTVQVQPQAATGWRALYSGGTSVTVPAGAAVVVSPPSFASLRLHADIAQGADRVFDIDSQIG
jgi:hypothetical protein